MTEFYMMIGIAGSGKSFIAEKYARLHDAVIVSSDAIRGELFGDENDQTHNAEVFNEVHHRILKALYAGQNAIYDATNLSAKRRKAFLKQLPADVEKIAVVIATDLDVALRQNASRDRQVPPDVIKTMLLRLQMPRISEGWNGIDYISNPNNESDILSVIKPCVGFDQDNPHHSAELFDHMQQAAQYVTVHAHEYGFSGMDEAEVYVAALIHDIGKPICKTYKLWSGKIDDHAHYYGHADVGAYMVACLLRTVPEEDYGRWLTILELIQYHMDCYADPDHWLEKIEKDKGLKFRNMLELLHEGDKNGH